MAATGKHHCADKSRLLADYNRSVTEWAQAVRSLKEHAGNADFVLIMRVVDVARTMTQRAKAEYATHISEHGC